MSSERASKQVKLGLLAYGLDRPLTGIGRYAVELVSALAGLIDDVDITLLKPFPGSVIALERQLRTVRFYGRLLPSLMTVGPPQIAAVAARYKLNVVHDPFGVSPFLVPRSVARFGRVVTIHDMVPFVFPETHAKLTNLLFHHYLPLTLRHVDHVITDSVSSRRDIIRFYRLDPERISVIPIGLASHFTPASSEDIKHVLRRHDVNPPYLLTVGSLNPRKNLETLFEAYGVLKLRGLPHSLVVVGPTAWKSKGIFTRLRELGLEDSVMMTGYVDDGDLPALYSGADAFVFPSLYEGFGLPPLESMACGTPVVTSNTSSLPEVVGDAGIMVDPRDVAGLTRAIERLITDWDLHSKLGAEGLERSKKFTWATTARAYIDVYRSAIRISV